MYKRISVAVDGTQESLRAVQEARGIAQVHQSDTVCLVTVIPVLVYSDADYDPIRAHGDEQTRLVAPAIAMLDEAHVRSELVLLHGRPADEIARYVNETEADLLIVGSRSLSKMQAVAVGGSVSQRIIKQVTCPVMIVK